ncbi:hypothetical protein GGI24_001644 [Coemansia furcata]|nr:hypothetical protein GGI24_001644 [Coemansia furcata]
MSFFNDKLSLNKINQLFPTKALYEAHSVEPKTRVELRMIKASALIRSTPDWADKLNDEEKCQEWTTQAKDAFNLTDKEVEYVFEELLFYAQLKENSNASEELGAIDFMWITNAASNCELAGEFKHNAAVLEGDFIQTEAMDGEPTPLTGLQALVDPFLYPLVIKESYILTKPVESPEDSLNIELPRVKPETLKGWFRTINYLNKRSVKNGAKFDKRKLSQLVNGDRLNSSYQPHKYWLPTDFHVGEDGSVTIRSYINNLHPARYAALYQSISKVFAKFVPLLEQVATDMIHPRNLRVEFSRESCIVSDMLHPSDVHSMVEDGVQLPLEYQKYIIPSEGELGNANRDNVRLDMEALYDVYYKSVDYKEPVPKVFYPSVRPLKPYSMRRMALQASVEMSNIYLTPENPESLGYEWQAVGRAEERIFAVGLYFYDVENIASAKIKFRDTVWPKKFRNHEDYHDFCKAHDVDTDHGGSCTYTQDVGEVEIKSGSYICYPNFYQTKMPSFELADPTRPGHVKYIAFYIVDPTQRLVSTEIVPPQQPYWEMFSRHSPSANVVEGMSNVSSGRASNIDDEKNCAIDIAEHLRGLHHESNSRAMSQFSVYMH